MAKSTLGSLFPLVVLFLVLVVAVGVGFVVYQVVMEVANTTSQKMEKHNVSLGPEGMKVGVKGMTAEQVGDNTQSVMMKVWNASQWPAYQSRLGWGQSSTSATEQRQAYSRSASSQSVKKG